MAISTELVNGILEMVYIASLEGNTTTVTDAKDRTESSGGIGGCIINAEERCDTDSNNGDKNNKKLSAIITSASAFFAGLFTSKSATALIQKSIDKTIKDYDDI